MPAKNSSRLTKQELAAQIALSFDTLITNCDLPRDYVLEKLVQATPAKVVDKTIASVPFGTPFMCRGKRVCKVKPTGYLLNSSVVTDSAARGKYLLLNLDTYTVFYSDANTYERLL